MKRLRPHSLPAAAMYYRIAAAGTALPATRMKSLRMQRANARGGGVAGRCGARIHAVNTHRAQVVGVPCMTRCLR